MSQLENLVKRLMTLIAETKGKRLVILYLVITDDGLLTWGTQEDMRAENLDLTKQTD